VRVIVGNEDNIVGIMTCLLARGHVLLRIWHRQDQAGANAGRCAAFKFARIQFTPDLMPGDIIGTNIVRRITRSQVSGIPAWTNLCQSGIGRRNRATPKTQSALPRASGEQRIRGWPDASTGAALLRFSNHESVRDGGHLSAARSSARSILL
jgi:MoxR-like ATPase